MAGSADDLLELAVLHGLGEHLEVFAQHSQVKQLFVLLSCHGAGEGLSLRSQSFLTRLSRDELNTRVGLNVRLVHTVVERPHYKAPLALLLLDILMPSAVSAHERAHMGSFLSILARLDVARGMRQRANAPELLAILSAVEHVHIESVVGQVVSDGSCRAVRLALFELIVKWH